MSIGVLVDIVLMGNDLALSHFEDLTRFVMSFDSVSKVLEVL